MGNIIPPGAHIGPSRHVYSYMPGAYMPGAYIGGICGGLYTQHTAPP